MRFLFDTSALLWWDSNSDKLSTIVYDTIKDEETTIYLSYISIWEIQIKHQIGKLNLMPLAELIHVQRTENNTPDGVSYL